MGNGATEHFALERIMRLKVSTIARLGRFCAALDAAALGLAASIAEGPFRGSSGLGVWEVGQDPCSDWKDRRSDSVSWRRWPKALWSKSRPSAARGRRGASWRQAARKDDSGDSGDREA